MFQPPTTIPSLYLKELTGRHLVTTGQSRGGSLRVSPCAEYDTVLLKKINKSRRSKVKENWSQGLDPPLSNCGTGDSYSTSIFFSYKTELLPYQTVNMAHVL